MVSLELDDQLDKKFKPGVCEQMKAFQGRDSSLFCIVDEQIRHHAIYNEMARYY